MEGFSEAVSDLKMRLQSLCDNIPLNPCEQVCVRSPRPKSDRFLINLYEWPTTDVENRRRSFNKTNVDFERNKLWMVDKNDNNVFCKKNDNLYKKKLTMDQFVHLKGQRDVECLKIKEASKVLRHLSRCSAYGLWLERLLAEKILLKSGKAVELLTQKIRDEYFQIREKEIQIATISLSDVKFHVTKPTQKPNETDFYVLLLSNDLEVKASKFARAVNGDIVFDEAFTFSVHRNFQIKVQLYTITMKDAPKYFTLCKFLPYHKSLNQVSLKLQYKNPNTSDFEETEVLKTSFKLIAETEVTASNLHNRAWILNPVQDTLNEYAELSTKIKSFRICRRYSGFLTLGSKFEYRTIWNRKWCVLDGQFLKIYNSPLEEDLIAPGLSLDLVNCANDHMDVAPKDQCSRPKSLMVEIQDDGESTKKYFFMADNCDDLKNWITEFNLILELLKFKNSYNL